MSSAIAIPGPRVREIALSIRKSRRAYASVLMYLGVALGAISRSLPYASFVAMGVLVLAGRQWWLANDAQRILTLADDPGISFALSGSSVAAADARGVLHVDASIKLTRRQRATLLALPSATLRR